MVARKSRTNSEHSMHKMNPKFVRRTMIILNLINQGMNTQKEIQTRSGLSRRETQYTITNLMNDGLCYDPSPKSNKWKNYKITKAGIQFIAEVRTADDFVNKVMNENIRMKCDVRNPEKIPEFTNHSSFNFIENKNWKNSRKWNGKVREHTIEVNLGKRQSSIVLIAPRYFGSTGTEVGYLAIKGMIDVCSDIKSKFGLDLGSPEIIEGEYVFHSPYSEAVMKKTGGRQVKTSRYKVNASKPYYVPHEEFSDPLHLDKHLQIPKKIDDLENKIMKISGSVEESNYKVSEMESSVVRLIDVLQVSVSRQDESTKALSGFADKFTGFADSLANLVKAVNDTKSKVESTIGNNEKLTNPEIKNDILNQMFK